MAGPELLRKLPETLRPEATRLVIRPFIPSDDPTASTPELRSRVGRVIGRILDLDAEQVRQELARVLTSLGARHNEVRKVLMRRYRDMGEAYALPRRPDPLRALLIGAVLSDEYAFEAAALFNPSIVPHPDQTGVQAGAVRFVLSLRGIGEGHVSAISFRTGVFTGDGGVLLDPPAPKLISPRIDLIPGNAADDLGTRLTFGATDDLSRIVIFPVTERQRHGLEDLRLVRFEDEGTISYIGTYTAFSGEAIRQEILRTSDFSSFELNGLRGPAANTKGMALFPKRVGGHYAALGRQDHESLWLMRSNDLYDWRGGEKAVSPRYPWEVVQIGNCSPPIELAEGWLIITHGVGPVRNYSLGACLLDKRDPGKLLARSERPLVTPEGEARDGYVPNVVYTCGALLNGRSLLLPYSLADTMVAFATFSVDALLATLR